MYLQFHYHANKPLNKKVIQEDAVYEQNIIVYRERYCAINIVCDCVSFEMTG